MSLLAQRSPVRVDEGFLRLVFRLTFQFIPLLKQRATAVIDGAGIGPHGLFFRRVAFFDLFDARLQRVIVIRFDRLASRFGNEFPFHGFWIVEGGREAVVFGHVVGFPRDFFFHLSVFFQDVRGHPRFRRGKFFVRPGRFERRERPAWHVKCGDARALVHTAQAYAHHRSYTCSSVYRAPRAREREKKKAREKVGEARDTKKESTRTCIRRLETSSRNPLFVARDRSSLRSGTGTRVSRTSLGRPCVVRVVVVVVVAYRRARERERERMSNARKYSHASHVSKRKKKKTRSQSSSQKKKKKTKKTKKTHVNVIAFAVARSPLRLKSRIIVVVRARCVLCDQKKNSLAIINIFFSDEQTKTKTKIPKKNTQYRV